MAIVTTKKGKTSDENSGTSSALRTASPATGTDNPARAFIRELTGTANSLFRKREIITEDKARRAAERTARFFRISLNKLVEESTILSEICTTDAADPSDIRFDTDRIWISGINSEASFEMMLMTERSKIHYGPRHFRSILNRDWAIQLATDFTTGMTFPSAETATELFREAIAGRNISSNNPPRLLREKAVGSGFSYAQSLRLLRLEANVETARTGVLNFLSKNLEVINRRWRYTLLWWHKTGRGHKSSFNHYHTKPLIKTKKELETPS